MPVTLVHVHVKPDHVDDFIEASRANHEGSVEEPGNRRFDVLQSDSDPTRFILYEWYEDDAAVAAHKETPHYHAWRATVESWMAEPRHAERFAGLFPRDTGR
jgi:autoinducer 2-degrading protein